MPARDADVVEDYVAVAAASDRPAGRCQDQAAPTHREQRLRRGATRVGLLDRPAHAPGSAVDHRLTVLLRRLRIDRIVSPVRVTVTCGADRPRLDAEFPQRQT